MDNRNDTLQVELERRRRLNAQYERALLTEKARLEKEYANINEGLRLIKADPIFSEENEAGDSRFRPGFPVFISLLVVLLVLVLISVVQLP
jgi:hypothetical protein